MTGYRPHNPMIVQGDRTVLLEVHAEGYERARDALARFAELEKSPEHVHTYRITPLSLWNAAAAGTGPDEVARALQEHAKYPVPQNLLCDIAELMGRYGKIRLLPGCRAGSPLRIEVSDPTLREELGRRSEIQGLLAPDGAGFTVRTSDRGTVKQKLARMGYPVEDRVGFENGEALPLALLDETRGGLAFGLHPFQREAVRAFLSPGIEHGVVVLPCGAGKTMVGMGVMAELGSATLILCTGVTAVRQWIRELVDKTTLEPDQIGEYTGQRKQVRPVTVSTYQTVSHRKGSDFPHLELFNARHWGLLVYDEVHLLPAPVFRVTAGLQARRRLGLTATLIREDGLETDVFSLIGPKRCDVPWREVERQGHIAEAVCREIRVAMPPAQRAAYAAAADEPRRQYRIAAENPAKDGVAAELAALHRDAGVLVIGQYIRQLERLAAALDAPLITGKTSQVEREDLYARFRRGELRLLVVSRVANFSLDLPDASVCIQVSGTYGSRQEEAQRLGRILRPKEREACFYSLVSAGTDELRFAMNRQLFLTEQGYRYYIEDHGGTDPAADGRPRRKGAEIIRFPGSRR